MSMKPCPEQAWEGSGATAEGMALDGSVGSGQALHVAGGKKEYRNRCTVTGKGYS